MKLKPAYQNFEQTFLLLLEQAKRGPISVHTFLTTLSGRGRILLLMFLSLGFAQIPGIAIVLGLFISYLGVRMAVGRNFIWMPKFLRHKKIASYFLIKVSEQTLQMLKLMKCLSRPRYEWAIQKSTNHVVNGLVIALVGLCLASSPPMPMTGMIASVAIFLIAIGLLNDDGLYIILGYIVALFYLITVLLLLKYFSFTQIFEWIKKIIPSS